MLIEPHASHPPADRMPRGQGEVRYCRRRDLPGVELRTVHSSAQSFLLYSTGFEFLAPLAPSTWEGEIWHRRRRGVVGPGWVLSAHPGDVFAAERVLAEGSWSSLTIDADVLGSYVPDRQIWDQLQLRPFACMSPLLSGRLTAAMEAMRHGRDPTEVSARVRMFLETAAYELAEPVPAARSEGGRLPSRAAERFACFRRDLGGRVPLGELASETGRSKFQALRAFKRRFGLTPQMYQLRVRLGLAQKSLRAGGLPADVAVELGFVDQSHFTRHFKRFVGVTPAAYARGAG